MRDSCASTTEVASKCVDATKHDAVLDEKAVLVVASFQSRCDRSAVRIEPRFGRSLPMRHTCADRVRARNGLVTLPDSTTRKSARRP